MRIRWPLKKQDKERMKYPRTFIHPKLASSAVILAHPQENELGLSKRLKDITIKGYDIRHTFRPIIEEPGFYSEELCSFMDLLEKTGFAQGRPKFPLELTEKGRSLLEAEVLRYYSENPDLTERFTRDIGLDMNPIWQKHLKRYLSILSSQAS